MICDICNKQFRKKSHFTEHKNRKYPCVPVTACKYCDHIFATNKGMKRHMDTVCKKENNENYINKQKEILVNEKIKQLEIREAENNNKLERLEKEMELLKNIKGNTVINGTNIENMNVNNVNNFNNVTVNIITKKQITTQFINGPVIDTLQNYKNIFPKNITIENGNENGNENAKLLFIDTIVYQSKNKSLHKYIGNIIISFYKKKENISDQSFWCSDLDRMTFLVRILPSGTDVNIWIQDTKAETVKLKVITPLFQYIKKRIDKFSKKIGESKTVSNVDVERCMTVIRITGNMDSNLADKIIKYIAPQFGMKTSFAIDNK